MASCTGSPPRTWRTDRRSPFRKRMRLAKCWATYPPILEVVDIQSSHFSADCGLLIVKKARVPRETRASINKKDSFSVLEGNVVVETVEAEVKANIPIDKRILVCP